MKIFDTIGLVGCLILFFFSVIGLYIGWNDEADDYLVMLFPLLISIWGIWGAGSLLLERRKKGKNGDRPK